jgi:hypothetical protein
MIDQLAFETQELADHAVSIPAIMLRKLDHRQTQSLIIIFVCWFLLLGVARHTYELARAPFRSLASGVC